MLQAFLRGLTELVFPGHCQACGIFLNGKTSHLCKPCLQGLTYNTPPFCLKCSRHLNTLGTQGLCQDCSHQDFAFDRAWGACIYDDTLAKLIHAFKYHGKTGLRHTFSDVMIAFIDTYHVPMEQFDLIIPIPLHAVRQRERTFNQSQLLAEILSTHYAIPLDLKALMRERSTETQTVLQAKQRWTNMSSAFKINDPSLIADKSILLVDDLMTTGATTHNAALALKEAGAAYVGVLTLSLAE